MRDETWLPVPQYKGYSVSNLGRVTLYTIQRPRYIGKLVKDFGNETPDESKEWTPKWGNIATKTQMEYSFGTYRIVTVAGLDDLARILADTTPGEDFITAGLPPADQAAGTFTCDPTATKHLRKTKDTFAYRKGGGVMVVDCDDALEPDAILDQLAAAGLADIGCVWRPSSSSWLYDGHGRQLSGARGSHLYILVRDATDIPRAGDVLFKRLWLAGLGWIQVSSAGAALKRTVYDRAMLVSSQPCFCAGALCQGGVVQREREPVVFEGREMADTRALLPDLTVEEQARYLALVEAAEVAAEPECAAKRHEHAIRLGTRRLGRPPTDDEVAQIVSTLERSVGMKRLDLDFMIEFTDGSVRSVLDILRGGTVFNGAVVRDPVEPQYLAGKLYIDGGVPNLHSQAGEKVTYELGTAEGRSLVDKERRALLGAILAARSRPELNFDGLYEAFDAVKMLRGYAKAEFKKYLEGAVT